MIKNNKYWLEVAYKKIREELPDSNLEQKLKFEDPIDSKVPILFRQYIPLINLDYNLNSSIDPKSPFKKRFAKSLEKTNSNLKNQRESGDYKSINFEKKDKRLQITLEREILYHSKWFPTPTTTNIISYSFISNNSYVNKEFYFGENFVTMVELIEKNRLKELRDFKKFILETSSRAQKAGINNFPPETALDLIVRDIGKQYKSLNV